jgi:hypothetical protein
VHPDDLILGVANPQLVQPFAERFQPGGLCELDAVHLELVLDGCAQGGVLDVAEVVEPVLHR